MLVKGFKFGMMLQFAIGPVCIFIFQIASLQGFFTAETGALGVTFIDGLFILAAILGIATVMDNKNIRSGLTLFGAAIFFVFGLNLVLSFFDINLLPSISIVDYWGTNNAFIYAIILTASSPLTILFWAGVFSTKVVEENMKRKDIYVFGFGALFATVFFLTLVAFMGSLTHAFVTPFVLQVLNITVGIAFIYFAVKMILKKTESQKVRRFKSLL
jgi:threonine/homoserine/homoserine lactone efflux protein